MTRISYFKSVQTYIELPEKFRLIPIYGTSDIDRMVNAKLEAQRQGGECYYIEKKPYKASSSYLFVVDNT
jgi:hypothetical protein